MNNQDNAAPTTETVAHNVYFEGRVQSLGMETAEGKATLGVMKSGNYTFSTSSPEKMVVISGSMEVRLPGSDFKAYGEQESFEVAAGSSFEVKCAHDVAYLCYYA